MKKSVLLFILLLFIVGCKEIFEKEVPEEKVSLSELQVEACNGADNAGACDTRLAELGIVLKEDCCESLGKCC